MQTHADKTTDKQSQPAEINLLQKEESDDLLFQFIDNRPEAVFQRQILGFPQPDKQGKESFSASQIIDNRPRMVLQRKLQNMALNSHRNQTGAYFKQMAYNYAEAQIQRYAKQGTGGVVQRYQQEGISGNKLAFGETFEELLQELSNPEADEQNPRTTDEIVKELATLWKTKKVEESRIDSSLQAKWLEVRNKVISLSELEPEPPKPISFTETFAELLAEYKQEQISYSPAPKGQNPRTLRGIVKELKALWKTDKIEISDLSVKQRAQWLEIQQSPEWEEPDLDFNSNFRDLLIELMSGSGREPAKVISELKALFRTGKVDENQLSGEQKVKWLSVKSLPDDTPPPDTYDFMKFFRLLLEEYRNGPEQIPPSQEEEEGGKEIKERTHEDIKHELKALWDTEKIKEDKLGTRDRETWLMIKPTLNYEKVSLDFNISFRELLDELITPDPENPRPEEKIIKELKELWLSGKVHEGNLTSQQAIKWTSIKIKTGVSQEMGLSFNKRDFQTAVQDMLEGLQKMDDQATLSAEDGKRRGKIINGLKELYNKKLIDESRIRRGLRTTWNGVKQSF